MGAIQIVDEPKLSPDLDVAIRRTLATAFPADAEFFSHNRAWHGSAPSFSALVVQGEEVTAHLGAVRRRVIVGGAPVDVAGIQNVCVLPEYRGQGLCREILDAVMAEALRRGFDFGLLFCVAELVPLYVRCGWRQLQDRLVIRVDSDGREKPLVKGNLPMWCPLVTKVFPDGEVHLNGNDW